MPSAVARALVPLIVLGLLAGCAAAPDPVESATAAPSPTATPDAPAPAEEVVAFGGDCDSLLPIEVIASALRSEAGEVIFLQRDAPPEQLAGALSCAWRGTAGALYVRAAPVSVIDEPVREEYAEYRCGAFWICGRAVEEGALWLHAEVDLGLDDGDDGSWRAPVDDVLASLLASASLYPEPVPAEPGEGWWSPLPACDRFLDSGAVGRILGADDLLSQWPTDAVPPGPLALAVAERGLNLDCSWIAENGKEDRGFVGVDLTVMPGAGRLVDALLDERGGPAVAVAGADRSGLIVDEFGRTLYAVIGDNAVRLYTRTVDDETVGLLAGEALATLASAGS